MSPALLYALVLLAYLPGVVVLVCWRKCWYFPILCTAFLGMLFFNALGSIGVFDEKKIYPLNFDTAEIAEEFALILVFQALAFYAVVGAYLLLRKPVIIKPQASGLDLLAVWLAAIGILFIAGLYYQETGTFLLLATLDHSMNVDNALSFREKYVYGLKLWPFYNLAFVFLPVVLSNYGLILVKSHRRYRALFALAIVVSFGASLSLGSKGGVFGFVLTLGVAYLAYLGMTGQSMAAIFRSRAFIVFVLGAVAVMVLGYLWATPETLDATTLIKRLWYRIFVAYPETLAASVSYARHYGTLGISVLPTMRGLLAHDQISLSLLLHQYEAGAAGGVSVPFAGEAFLLAGWSTVILVLPCVFGVLVLLQEVAFCFTDGLISIAFSALYAYLAVVLALNGMFASLFNFMYPCTLFLLGLTVLGVKAIFCRFGVRLALPRESA